MRKRILPAQDLGVTTGYARRPRRDTATRSRPQPGGERHVRLFHPLLHQVACGAGYHQCATFAAHFPALREFRRTQVSTTMVSGGMASARDQGGGPTTRAMGTVQTVSQYDFATVETKLFDVRPEQLVWAATTTTFNPGSVGREAPAFADLIIGQLASRSIIARP